jgi:hypothetical protein
MHFVKKNNHILLFIIRHDLSLITLVLKIQSEKEN